MKKQKPMPKKLTPKQAATIRTKADKAIKGYKGAAGAAY